ncbi:hypothetical protein [Thauera butanivorans]|uniref:chorismate transformation enzyme, FkbO/Hyg5 family n=1 Tax=Thauera butanivorans TaxID=86174 RepID=UPI000A4002CC|nr:hypothetical protein [Thauera butanivorans]
MSVSSPASANFAAHRSVTQGMSFLSFQTAAQALHPACDAASVLGGTRLGTITAAEWPEQTLPAVLSASSAQSGLLRECWLAFQPCIGGHDEGIAWRRAGDLLYGVIELDEAGFAGASASPLQAAAEAAYRRIFRLLDAQGLPELWRAWNYMAAINRETRGLERYRQFNIGRQNAFDAARGAGCRIPAACALGLADGPLSIAFMAGREAIVPIENPRQISAWRYPEDYGPRSPTFSRAALAYPPGQEVLFISGTASIVGHRTLHADDVAAQTRESLLNVLTVLEEANRVARAGPFRAEGLSCRAYLRHAGDLPVVDALVREMLGGAEVCYLEADVCRADLLVEIEAMALQTR